MSSSFEVMRCGWASLGAARWGRAAVCEDVVLFEPLLGRAMGDEIADSSVLLDWKDQDSDVLAGLALSSVSRLVVSFPGQCVVL